MNDEKATEYILQSQIFQLWTATANKIVNYASDEITVKDIRAMITLDYWTVIAILQTKFSMINIIIKEKYPDIYQEAQEKSDLIKKLREDWIRKSMWPEWPNEFDGMAEHPILNQLAANTTSYLQYINSQYSDENQVINISTAPRFRYFSAQFGGGLRKVLLDTMWNYIIRNNMKKFYWDTKTWMSPQAEEQLDARIKATTWMSYKDLAIHEGGRLPAMMDTPDWEIYWCPVQGSFRHFYKLVILTLKEHIEKL